MSETTLPITYRISRGTKVLMLIMAAAFDLLPLLVLLFVFAITFNSLADMGACAAAVAPPAGDGGYIDSAKATVTSWFNGAKCGFSIAAGLLSGTIVFLFAGPFIYLGVSLVVLIIAYLGVFPVWFMVKGVNVFSFSGSKMLVNGISMLVEMIPFTSWLPGITLWTWRHIKISRREDKKKHAEKLESVNTQVARAEKLARLRLQYA